MINSFLMRKTENTCMNMFNGIFSNFYRQNIEFHKNTIHNKLRLLMRLEEPFRLQKFMDVDSPWTGVINKNQYIRVKYSLKRLL